MEKLARHNIQASFSQARMTYFHEESKVTHESEASKWKRCFLP
jgi:hypothetical protein